MFHTSFNLKDAIKQAAASFTLLNTKEWMKSSYAPNVLFHSLPQEGHITLTFQVQCQILSFLFCFVF